MHGGIAVSSALIRFSRLAAGRVAPERVMELESPGSRSEVVFPVVRRYVTDQASSMPYCPQYWIDLHEFPILEWYLSPCALVVPSGGAQPVDDLPQNFAGPSAQYRGPQRELQNTLEKTDRNAPS